MDVRDDPVVEAYLVTEAALSNELANLAKLHGVKHFIAPLKQAAKFCCRFPTLRCFMCCNGSAQYSRMSLK